MPVLEVITFSVTTPDPITNTPLSAALVIVKPSSREPGVPVPARLTTENGSAQAPLPSMIVVARFCATSQSSATMVRFICVPIANAVLLMHSL